MLYQKNEQKKDITLDIKTVIIDEAVNSPADELLKFLQILAADENTDLADLFDEKDRPDNISEVRLSTEAEIYTNPHGNIEIKYVENEDDPAVASTAKIIFSPADPGLVMMEKQGAINSLLSFEEGKTHICEYDTPYMSFKIYITSHKVTNRLLRDGKLYLEYTLNINDTDPQRFLITVTVKEAPADSLRALFR